MNGMSEMYGNINFGDLALIVMILVIVIGIPGYLYWRRNRLLKERDKYIIPPDLTQEAPQSVADVTPLSTQTAPKAAEMTPTVPEQPETPLGQYPSYIIRRDRSFDFDYINIPMGSVFVSDTSMPHNGVCYLVREKKSGGGYEEYDPRTAPLISTESPIRAWFATHWKVVHEVFSVPAPWWKSTPVWIAGATGIAAFFVILATVGG